MHNNFNVILTGTPSDSHTWNLIMMELFLKENNCQVRNLGACVPIEVISYEIKKRPPDLIIFSSINGHLFQDGIKVMNELSQNISNKIPIVIGGQLGITSLSKNFQKQKLLKIGFDDVFVDKDAMRHFQKYLYRLKSKKNILPFKHAL